VGASFWSEDAANADPKLKNRRRTMKKQVLISTAAAVSMMFATGSLHASPTTGTWATRGSVDAKSSYKFGTMSFFAGEPAEVIIKGNGATALHLMVLDRTGKLVTEDVCQKDACAVRWQPNKTDEFQVVVENQGSVYNAYEVVMN
jgi:hypothetical protein